MAWLSSPAVGVVEYRLLGWRQRWSGSVISSVLAPVLYLGAMGWGLGGLVDAHSGGVDGLPYLVFIVPGVLALTAMQTAVNDSGYPVMSGLRWDRHFEGMAATSLQPSQLAVGLLGFVAIKLTLTCALFLAVAAVFGALTSPLAGLALPAAVLTGLAFAGPVIAYTALLHSDVGLTLLFRFGVLPLSLFAGTFFPIDVLPVALRWLAQLTPLWHGVELCRALTTGQVQPDLLGHVGYLLLWTILGGWLAARQLRRRLLT